MDITKIDIRILNDDRKGFSHFKTVYPGQLVSTDAEIVRLAHTYAAQELERRFPGQWCYRYANLRHTDNTPANLEKLDGVTNMDWIADEGFRGQFQWIDGGLGGYVPATVDITNPVKQAQYELETRERRERHDADLAARRASRPAPQGVKWVEFGYGSMDAEISRDGERLATLLTPDDIGKDEPTDLMSRFIEAGGNDDHSGYSWGCVKSVAAVLVKHGWKTVDEIPADSPLYERIRQ